MNTYRVNGYESRTPLRRLMDTVDRLDHLTHREIYDDHKSRLPRKAILVEGIDMLKPEARECRAAETHKMLANLFQGFDPMKELDNMKFRRA